MEKARCWILYKAESARRLLHSIQTHNDPFYLPDHGEQLVGLLFARVERHVPYVKRGAVAQFLLVFLDRELRKEYVQCIATFL